MEGAFDATKNSYIFHFYLNSEYARFMCLANRFKGNLESSKQVLFCKFLNIGIYKKYMLG